MESANPGPAAGSLWSFTWDWRGPRLIDGGRDVPTGSPHFDVVLLDDGFFETRRDLYNLYPLLVHVRLFGGSYLASARSTLARFGC